MEGLSLVVNEHVPNDGRAEQQHHLQPLIILDLDAVKVRFHNGQLLQLRKESHSNVRLFALFRLLADQVRRFASHVACQVLAISALLPPAEVHSGCCCISARVVLVAVERRGAWRTEGDLRYAKLPTLRPAPLGLQFFDDDLRIRVVELYGELVWEDRLRWRRHPAILAYLLL